MPPLQRGIEFLSSEPAINEERARRSNQCLDGTCRRCTAGALGVIVADVAAWAPACGSWDATGRRAAMCVISGSGGHPVRRSPRIALLCVSARL
jgi:hypothetical protein